MRRGGDLMFDECRLDTHHGENKFEHRIEERFEWR
jgi:hypothetical protein